MGLLKFLLVMSVLIAVLVFFVLPAVAGPILTGLARNAGIGGTDVTVDVEAGGAQLLGGGADGLRVRGRDLTVEGIVIGGYDVTLGRVALFDRRFETVKGTLSDVRLGGTGARALQVRTLALEGPADAARASGRVERADAERMIADAVRRAGLPVGDVDLRDGHVELEAGGRRLTAELAVADGRLLARLPNGRSVELMRAGRADAWRLDDVDVRADGLAVRATIDLQSIARDMPGLGT